MDPETQAGERAYTGVHRGMDGEPLTGKIIGTKTSVNFPQVGNVGNSAPKAVAAPKVGSAPENGRNGLDGRNGQTVSAVPAGGAPDAGAAGAAAGVGNVAGQAAAAALSGFPQRAAATGASAPSAMETGNPRVGFKGAGERYAEMQMANAARLAGVQAGMKAATEAQARGPQPVAVAVPGGVFATRPGGASVSSVYGTGSSTFPQPGGERPGTRIADETGDRTREFTPGGKSSSTEFPQAPAAGRSGSSGTAIAMRQGDGLNGLNGRDGLDARETQPVRGTAAPPDLASVPQVTEPPPDDGAAAPGASPRMPQAQSGEWMGPPLASRPGATSETEPLTKGARAVQWLRGALRRPPTTVAGNDPRKFPQAPVASY